MSAIATQTVNTWGIPADESALAKLRAARELTEDAVQLLGNEGKNNAAAVANEIDHALDALIHALKGS